MMRPRTLSNVIAGKLSKISRKTFKIGLTVLCREDCEGNQFFSTSEFLERKYTDYKYYYDENKQRGVLSNYLLDPDNFFFDPVTTNLTRLIYNASKADLAKMRFHNDISILNFFFDTPQTLELKRELRMTILDQISAIGGTMGKAMKPIFDDSIP